MSETKTIYITKYATTKGVLRRSAYISEFGTAHVTDFMFPFQHDEYYITETEAVAAAEHQRAKRMASLEKTLDRLRNLTIKVR